MPSTTETTQEPRKQELMEVEASTQAPNAMVTEQPKSEPPPYPEAQPAMTLRGGALSFGFDCCHGSCRFHKSCC